MIFSSEDVFPTILKSFPEGTKLHICIRPTTSNLELVFELRNQNGSILPISGFIDKLKSFVKYFTDNDLLEIIKTDISTSPVEDIADWDGEFDGVVDGRQCYSPFTRILAYSWALTYIKTFDPEVWNEYIESFNEEDDEDNCCIDLFAVVKNNELKIECHADVDDDSCDTCGYRDCICCSSCGCEDCCCDEEEEEFTCDECGEDEHDCMCGFDDDEEDEDEDDDEEDEDEDEDFNDGEHE